MTEHEFAEVARQALHTYVMEGERDPLVPLQAIDHALGELDA